jgi:hypothetical protein
MPPAAGCRTAELVPPVPLVFAIVCMSVPLVLNVCATNELAPLGQL